MGNVTTTQRDWRDAGSGIQPRHRREENSCDKEDVPEEAMPAKSFPLKELLELLPNIQSTKDKMLETDPNLVEKSKTLCQGSLHLHKMTKHSSRYSG